MKTNLQELQKIYTTVGIRKGWDFSMMRTDKEPAPWDYIEIVRRYIKPTDNVLDIGTGGGERFIQTSKYFLKGVGIDPDKSMIHTAKSNAVKNNISHVVFKIMGAENLKFPKNSFDIVLNRHAVIDSREIVKVLKPGGYFITQQVEKENMNNLKKIFNDKRTWKNDAASLSREFKKNDCSIIGTGKYNIRYWVKDLESLIFWLKAVNLPENFDIKDHGIQLLNYVENFSTPQGFITNEAREFLVVRKK